MTLGPKRCQSVWQIPGKEISTCHNALMGRATHMLACQFIDLGNSCLTLEGGIEIDVKLHLAPSCHQISDLPRQVQRLN